MTTTVTVFAHCNKDTEVQVTINDPSFNPELTILQNGESTEKHVYDDRSITIREVMLKKMGDVQDTESTVEHDLSPVQLSPELISSNIKRDNGKLLAEKIMVLETNPNLTDDEAQALGAEVVELAKGILATCPDPHEEPTV